MAKKCGLCGTPALDDLSEFCNRCGSPVKEKPVLKVPVCSRCKSPAPNAEALFCNRCGTEYPTAEPEHNYPLCPRCGYTIPDDQSQFCNRCGAAVKTKPANKRPVCLKCGASAPDDLTLFCNRCGTQFNPPVSDKKPVHPPALPVSVKISKKKHVPAVVTLEDLWDPVPDEEFKEEYSPPPVAPPVSPSRKKYAHLPLIADELAGGKVKSESIIITGNIKKYAHLPLIADEFKEKQSPRLEIESPYLPGPPKEQKAGRSKKGLFDLLKK